jgi:capsular polysaccharide transport system permease protein
MIGNDFREALRIQGRVLLALMLREARTRYGRTRAGYLWAILEPVVHISALSLIYTFKLAAVPLGNSVILFLATGLATFLGFRRVMMRTEGGYGSNEALLSFPIVHVMDAFLGRALLELATWVAVSFILFTVLILSGIAPVPNSVLLLIEAVIALFAIGFGVGLFLGIVSEFMPSLQAIWNVPFRLLYLTSGIFFLPDRMPPAMRDILAWNPILHGIALFREGYYRGYESHILDVGYLYTWAVASVLCGLLLEKLTRKQLRNLTT